MVKGFTKNHYVWKSTSKPGKEIEKWTSERSDSDTTILKRGLRASVIHHSRRLSAENQGVERIKAEHAQMLQALLAGSECNKQPWRINEHANAATIEKKATIDRGKKIVERGLVTTDGATNILVEI